MYADENVALVHTALFLTALPVVVGMYVCGGVGKMQNTFVCTHTPRALATSRDSAPRRCGPRHGTIRAVLPAFPKSL